MNFIQKKLANLKEHHEDKYYALMTFIFLIAILLFAFGLIQGAIAITNIMLES